MDNLVEFARGHIDQYVEDKNRPLGEENMLEDYLNIMMRVSKDMKLPFDANILKNLFETINKCDDITDIDKVGNIASNAFDNYCQSVGLQDPTIHDKYRNMLNEKLPEMINIMNPNEETSEVVSQNEENV